MQIDVLLLTALDFFLIEIKSRPGRVYGDPGTWTWDTEGRLITAANPLLGANLKAKKLRRLLERQKAVKVKGSLPWVEALVFLSAPNVQCNLLTTGTLPKGGDGRSEPSQVDCEATIDEELFDPALRETLVPFLKKALKREARERFDNAEDMLRAWRDCFLAIEAADAVTETDAEELRQRLEGATFDSSIHELGLGTRATNALDRANVLTVEDLLTVPMRRLLRLRGVGNKTRREIATAVKVLRSRLGSPPSAGEAAMVGEEPEEQPAGDLSRRSVDLLAQRLTRPSPGDGETVRQTVTALLGLEEARPGTWPEQAAVARFLAVSRARVGQVVGKVVDRWAKKDKALTRLREDIAGLLARQAA